MGQVSVGGIAPENALDALLDELQTFAKPMNNEVGLESLSCDLDMLFEDIFSENGNKMNF